MIETPKTRKAEDSILCSSSCSTWAPLLVFSLPTPSPRCSSRIAPLIPAAVATGERSGIFVATAVFMIAILAALVASYVLDAGVAAG